MSAGKKHLFELAVVLDDPVVHDGNPPRAVGVRMGVAIAGPAVRRPARVADPEGGSMACVQQRSGQIGHPAERLLRHYPVADEESRPRAVVPAILETP